MKRGLVWLVIIAGLLLGGMFALKRLTKTETVEPAAMDTLMVTPEVESMEMPADSAAADSLE